MSHTVGTARFDVIPTPEQGTEQSAGGTVRRLPIHRIDSPRTDPYRDKVVYTYDDSPEDWRKALGDTLLFEWGLYDDPDLPQADQLGQAGIRFFDQQLHLAGLMAPDRRPLSRILDLGCGWGYIAGYLAKLFPECQRIDAINVSPRQLDYCADYLTEHRLADRVALYLCDGQDVDLLPDPDHPYDLIVIRGVYTHCMNEVFENSVRAVAGRIRDGAPVVISDNLYHQDPATYSSEIPDLVDRLACGHRKTPEYFAGVLKANGLAIEDMRVLPSNREVTRWFHDVKHNIERNFPHGATGPLEELRVMADNMSAGLAANKVSAYSIIARHAEGGTLDETAR